MGQSSSKNTITFPPLPPSPPATTPPPTPEEIQHSPPTTEFFIQVLQKLRELGPEWEFIHDS